MIEQTQQKPTLKIDLQKIQSFLDVMKKYILNIYHFFRDNKNNSKVMLFIAVITFGIAIYFGIQLYSDIAYLKGKTPELMNLKSYDLRNLQDNVLTQPIVKTSDTLKDLIDENTLMQNEISKYSDYLSALQVPYTYLLQYIYLPSLNVWKEKYTDKIDVNLI